MTAMIVISVSVITNPAQIRVPTFRLLNMVFLLIDAVWKFLLDRNSSDEN